MQLLLFLIIVLVTMILLFAEAFPAEVIGLLVMFSLGASGLVSWKEAFSGFGSNAVMAMFGLFIIGGALRETGVAAWLGDRMVRLARGNEAALIALVMGAGTLLSAIMVNIGTVAVLLPAVMSAGHKAKIPPSRLVMPLGMGTIVGGMLTLIGATPTIILNEFLTASALPSFHLFEQTLLVLPLAILSIGLMVSLRRVLLPQRSSVYADLQSRSSTLIRAYALDHVLHEVVVRREMPLAGKTLGECDLRARFDVYVLGVQRRGRFLPPPTSHTVLRAGDHLLVRATDEALERAAATCGLRILSEVKNFPPTLLREGLQMAEVAIAPRASLAGKTVAEVDFFNRYGLRIFAINHRGTLKHYHLAEHRLGFGDALLLHGPPERIAALEKDEDFIVLEKTDTVPPQPTLKPRRAFLTLIVTIFTLSAVGFRVLPLGAASVGGATLLLMTGVLTIEEAYRAISWKVLIFIAGMLPLGAAMLHCGASARVGKVLGGWLAGHSVFWLYLLVAVVAALIGHLTSNVTAAVVTIPLALQTALHLGADPRAAALVAAIGASNVFSSPMYQVNVFLMGPGEYRPVDFLKRGMIFTGLITFGTALGAVFFG